MSIQDPRSSERYQPRWELWMPVFTHYALSNVVNALSSFTVSTHSMQGVMVSETRVAWDKLIGTVLILEAHMMRLWREKDSEFEKARLDFHQYIKTVDANTQPTEAMEKATDFYHELIELLGRRGFLRFKPPRSFGRKHDE